MNIAFGLKRIINVIFYIWVAFGFFGLVNGIKFTDILITCFIVPLILKYALFYIINGFTD